MALLGLALASCTSDRSFSPVDGIASVSPEVLTFAPLVANEETAIGELFVSNSGPVALSVEAIALEGDGFTLLTAAPFEVPKDETVTVEIEFAPTEVRAYEGLVTFTTDDLEAAAIRIPVVGEGRVPYAADIHVEDPTVVWDVAPGDSRITPIEILNVGDAPLDISRVQLGGSGAFSIVDSSDPTGDTVLPGQSTAMLVRYAPIPGRSGGDSGTVVLSSNDPDEPELTVNLEGNGGGGADDYPVAVIADCDRVLGLAGPEVAYFDGSGSYDPLGGALTYAWSLTLSPNGDDADVLVVDPYDPALASLPIDAAGDWEVQLIVTSDAGLPSVPAKCRIDAEPEDRIHVELRWGGPTSDMDLHLARDLGNFYTTPNDVSWCNANPDWGVPGNPDDDPRLDIDDPEGFGPENINILEPADGEYQVRVHLFDDGEDGETSATVTVFLDGEEAWEGTRSLTRNEVWDVGRIVWPEVSFSADQTEPWDAEGVRECQ